MRWMGADSPMIVFQLHRDQGLSRGFWEAGRGTDWVLVGVGGDGVEVVWGGRGSGVGGMV